MNKDMIIEALQRKINATAGGPIAGRRKKRAGAMTAGASKFDEYAGLVNPYDDDGSIAFKKLRVAVMTQMARDIYGIGVDEKVKMEELASLEKSDIDKEMAKLRKAEEIKLKKARKEIREAEERYTEMEPDLKAQRRVAKLEDYRKKEDADIFDLKNPYVAELKKKPLVQKASKDASTRNLPDFKYVDGQYKLEAAPKSYLQIDGKGRSEYNKFFAKKRKEGYSAAEVGKMWRDK